MFDKLTRNILATNPRVTRFKIDWMETSSSKFSFNDEHMTDEAMASEVPSVGLHNQLTDFDNSVGSLTHERMEL